MLVGTWLRCGALFLRHALYRRAVIGVACIQVCRVLLEQQGRLVTAVGRASRVSRATSGSPDRRGPSVSRTSRAVVACPETRVARDPTETSDHQIGTFAHAACQSSTLGPRTKHPPFYFLLFVTLIFLFFDTLSEINRVL